MHAVDDPRDAEREQMTGGRTRREALTKAAGLAAGTLISSAVLPSGVAGARTRSARRARHLAGDKRTSGLHYHTAAYPAEPYPSYDLGTVDQWNPVDIPDIVPAGDADRQTLAHELATDATIWGYASALQYVQLYQQAVDKSSPSYTGFDAFLHQRNLADPSFSTFRTPNVDTLYSNAWLDLTHGPALIEIPAFGNRYYTLNFLDMYSNATNISLRTWGGTAGRFVIVPPGSPIARHKVYRGYQVFRVATPYMWILMRILVENFTTDLATVHALQDRVKIRPTAPIGQGTFVPVTSTSVTTDPTNFFSVLDWTERTSGHPIQEDGLVYRYRTIGIGGLQPFEPSSLDSQTAAGMAAGFAEATTIISDVKGLLGTPVGNTGWVHISPGAYGFNYLRRATTNFVGTGGNVREEQVPFTTFVDGNGKQLNGATTNYTLHLDGTPPAGFWSVTLYILSTGELYANQINRYTISDRTPGVQYNPDGSLDILIQNSAPANTANWLPAPAAPFYIAFRLWQPSTQVLNGQWTPNPILP
jgi:hypothetical protein